MNNYLTESEKYVIGEELWTDWELDKKGLELYINSLLEDRFNKGRYQAEFELRSNYFMTPKQVQSSPARYGMKTTTNPLIKEIETAKIRLKNIGNPIGYAVDLIENNDYIKVIGIKKDIGKSK